MIGRPVKGALCQSEVHGQDVRLGLIHGVHLSDPRDLLQGDRKSKRFIEIRSLESVDGEAVESLLRAAAGFDPRRRTDP
jgi:hypothetical protein